MEHERHGISIFQRKIIYLFMRILPHRMGLCTRHDVCSEIKINEWSWHRYRTDVIKMWIDWHLYLLVCERARTDMALHRLIVWSEWGACRSKCKHTHTKFISYANKRQRRCIHRLSNTLEFSEHFNLSKFNWLMIESSERNLSRVLTRLFSLIERYLTTRRSISASTLWLFQFFGCFFSSFSLQMETPKKSLKIVE